MDRQSPVVPGFSQRSPLAFGQAVVARGDTQEARRARIQMAHQEGRLFVRSIEPSLENKFFEAQEQAPKPFTVLTAGMPSELFEHRSSVIAVTDLKTLYHYKGDADTNGLGLDKRIGPEYWRHHKRFGIVQHNKCLADMAALKEKMHEQLESRLWSAYKPGTSGHLARKGVYTLPAFKDKHLCNLFPIPHCEVVAETYEKRQIECFCVSSEDNESIVAILERKHKLEKSLRLKSLPVGVYSAQKGSLSVWFEDELFRARKSFHLLKKADKQLREHLSLQQIDYCRVQRVLRLLIWPEQIAALLSFGENYRSPSKHELDRINLLNIITDPDNYSAVNLRELHRQGVPLKTAYVSNWGKSLPVNIFLAREEQRYWPYNVTKTLTPNVDEKASELLHELVRCSGICEAVPMEWALKNYPDYIQEFLVSFDLLDKKGFCIYWHFIGLRYNEPVVAVACDRYLKGVDIEELQDGFHYALVEAFSDECEFQEFSHLLILLFLHGVVPDLKSSELICDLDDPGLYCNAGESESVIKKRREEFIGKVSSVWENYNTHSFVDVWKERVKKGEARVNAVRKQIGVCMKVPFVLPSRLEISKEEMDFNKQQLGFIVDAFRKPPEFRNPGDDEPTILKILEHYYRRPGAEVQALLAVQKELYTSQFWKRYHSCDHALRTRNNVCWYMEFLEVAGVATFSKDERILLALAAVYHDAAAEDVDKSREEKQSAFYFCRDMSPHFQRELVEKISKALEAKEDDINSKGELETETEQEADERLRLYLRVLRFGDRMDFVRYAGAGPGFPDWSKEGSCSSVHNGVDPGKLDLPPSLKTSFVPSPCNKALFQSGLEAAMHGSVDLVSVTEECVRDRRKAGSYIETYGLKTPNSDIKTALECTPTPVLRLNGFIDDNVRRMIAEKAGISTCKESESLRPMKKRKASARLKIHSAPVSVMLKKKHLVCRADTRKGVHWGIHNSWHDLKQIKVPEGMTLLEKMQCRHDLSVLAPKTRAGILKEVRRIKQSGIKMALGTLTQETLKSPSAQKALKRRGIHVVKEQRQRGRLLSGKPKYVTVCVPRTSSEARRPVS